MFVKPLFFNAFAVATFINKSLMPGLQGFLLQHIGKSLENKGFHESRIRLTLSHSIRQRREKWLMKR